MTDCIHDVDDTIGDCFTEGRAAYFDGLGDDDNPYGVGSREHHAWDQGWGAGAWDDGEGEFEE